MNASRCPDQKQHAFTLVELLVSIAIITILAGILLPALVHVKELTARTVCRNNQRQFYLTLFAYGSDYDDWLVSGKRDGDNYEDTRDIKDETYQTLVEYGGSADAFSCPNGIGRLWLSHGWYDNGWGTHVGQLYLGRHKTPFNTGGSTCGDWPSPKKFRGDSRVILITDDSISYLSSTPGNGYCLFMPHTRSGWEMIMHGGIRLYPQDYGGEGHNATRLDGATIWKKPEEFTEYNASNTSDKYHAFY